MPPPSQPTIPDLARALGALLRALGLDRVLLYGVHTGASIAARLAQDQPERIAGLVCDGLALFTDEERQPLLDGYLPPFEPVWDGSHLLWLWARLREQTLFFPWHLSTARARMVYPMATTQKVHADALDLLAAGDGYRAGYRAPLLYEHSRSGAATLTVPAHLLYREGDVLRPHLERHAALPAQVQACAVADAQALAKRMDEVFDGLAPQATVVDAEEQVADAACPWHRRIEVAGGALGFLCAPVRGVVTELAIGDIGMQARLPGELAATQPALALELPGHGASDRRPSEDLEPDRLAAAVVHALDRLLVDDVRIRAAGGACALAAALADRLGPRCVELVLADPLQLDEAESARFLSALPALEPCASGAHLIEAWNWARQSKLFWPWMQPDAKAAIVAAAPAPGRVHAEVVEMLRAGPNWRGAWQAALAQDLPTRLQALRCALRVEVRAGDAERERQALRIAQMLALQADPPGPPRAGWSRPAVN